MHNPGKSCKLIKFSPLASLPEAEAEFLEETFDVVAVNYTDDGLEEYVGYAPLDFDAEDFRRRVGRTRPEIAAVLRRNAGKQKLAERKRHKICPV